MSVATVAQRIAQPLNAKWPGLFAAVALAAAALWIAGGLGEPLARNPVLVAMLFGLLIGHVFTVPERLRPGLDFTKRQLLRAAVMLVGFRISASLLIDLGLMPMLVAAAELLVVLLAVRWITHRVFKVDSSLALLIAAGSAVCGAAAILSVAALTRAKEQHAGIAITLITLSGTAALLIYPEAFLGGWLPALDERSYGVFVGASIYELAQVYGASFAVSEGALNSATLVKLCKVLMLLPLLMVMGLWQRRQDQQAQRPPTPWPWFIAGFVAVMVFNSLVTLHPQVRRLILDLDQFLFVMVMVALGMTTRLSALAAPGALGWRLAGVAVVGLALSSGTAYSLLAGLAQRDAAAPDTSHARMLADPGGRLFATTGCAKCHVPALAGRRGEVPLYSDLLLHDMGAALDDKIVQGQALGTDWRTTPLIGLGVRTRYLHDGRATTLRDAVLAHGGEAEIVRERYFDLAADEQQMLLRFIGTL
jgi:uncharacterized integral membrane protein (TIGR00698 family)